MSVVPGTRLGPYEILGPLGAGGMGEVYRGRDTRLGREVALKVLPAELSSNEERLKRFEREARAASSLNHPNIVTIYDIGSSDSVSYIAMERVEGKTLREVLSAGALPVRRMLQIGTQIAEGLARAHEAGIVHRDLKPENVMVTASGLVKILDFGLAKLTWTGLGSDDGSNLPTQTATQPGIVMGTAVYMSPEQASGRPLDLRTDQFSLGSILYEMATGKRAFDRPTAAQTLAAIIQDEPESIGAINPKVPPPVRWIVERCLTKEPKERYASTEDLARDLVRVRDHLGEVSGSGEAVTRPTRSKSTLWVLAPAAAALLASVLAVGYLRRAPRPSTPIRASLILPEKTGLGSLALSPDGKRLAFTAGRNENFVLWIRALEEPTAHPVMIRGAAWLPFWSPDSRFVGFFSEGKLRRVDASGATIQTICDVESGYPGFGATWGADGTIVFARGPTSALYRVTASGGQPVAVTKLNASRHETSHRWPFFLPDGRHFLYMAADLATAANDPGNTIRVASLDGKEDKAVVPTASCAAYASGHLLYVRERTLFGRPFSLRQLQTVGDPVPLAARLPDMIGYGNHPFSVTERLLVFFSQPRRLKTLQWVDRSGKPSGTLGEPDFYGSPRLSPDGRKVAVDIDDPVRDSADIWIYDIATGVRTKFAPVFGGEYDHAPVWSPEGDRIFFTSDRESSGYALVVKAVDGKGDEIAVESSDGNIAEDWSADGRFLSFSKVPAHGKRNNQIWILNIAGERKASPLVTEAAVQEDSRFSPDGHWIAYSSKESGVFEVYVRAFPGPGGKRQISTTGGRQPRWRRDGKELFYLSNDNQIMAVPVRLNPTFDTGAHTALFSVSVPSYYTYDVSADGQRFLIRNLSGEQGLLPLTLITDWTALLKKD